MENLFMLITSDVIQKGLFTGQGNCPLWQASYFSLLRPCVLCFLPALCEPFQGSGSVAGVFITAFETWVEEGEEGEGNVGNDIIL